MLLAGLIELNGGRVTFPNPATGQTATLRANIKGSEVSIIAVAAQSNGTSMSFVVPEPSAGHRVVAVIPRTEAIPGARERLTATPKRSVKAVEPLP